VHAEIAEPAMEMATASASASASVAEAPAAPSVVERTGPTQLPHVVAPPPPREPPRPVGASSAPTQLPRVVTPAPTTPLPQLVRPSQPPGTPQPPPGLPIRGLREFRGPVRKMDLPPQPQRP